MELEPVNEIDIDLCPEFCQYRDDGCDVAARYLGRKASCLNCPFIKCIYDEPGGKQRLSKRLRAQEMARLFTDEGKGIKELAALFSVSRRTVQRALKSALRDTASNRDG
jgi:hypothetical protein